MNLEIQLKLQAWLDGELPPAEAREISGLVQRDPAAAALLAELKLTRRQLQGAEARVALPEAREFYWSKIERDIQRQSPKTSVRKETGFFDRLRLFILPAAAVTVLVIVAMAGHFHSRPGIPAEIAGNETPTVETALASTDSTTYRDASEGTTLVWFSDSAGAPAQGKKPPGVN